MKARNIFALLGLSVAMGVGVAAGASFSSSKSAEALASGETVYLLPNSDWKADSAKFALYTWKNESDNPTWTKMSAVSDTDYYSAVIPANAEKAIFVRYNPSEEPSWDSKWNQTSNLVLGEANGNIYKITGWDYSGEWDGGTFNPSDKPAEDGYYIVGTKSSWTFTGATKMTTCDEESENYAEILGYSGSATEEFKVRSYFSDTNISRWHGGSDNESFDEDGLYNIYLSKDGNIYITAASPDVPAEDGYYLVGSKTSFHYDGAPKMTQLDPVVTGNVAHIAYDAIAGEKIKVRSYFDGVDKYSYNDESYAYGEADEDKNFVFSTAGKYDIYAFYVGDDFKFSVTPFAEKVTVTLVAQQFKGKTFAGGEKIAEYEVVKGQAYWVRSIARSGYKQLKPYVNDTCTEEYAQGSVLNVNTTLYVMYMKAGFYVLAEADDWDILEASIMMTDGIDPANKAEATISVAAANEVYTVVYYGEDGVMSGNDGLGQEYSFVEQIEDTTNFKFLKDGVFSVYWSNGNNKVYVNEGVSAFLTGFLSATGGVCKTDNTTDLEALGVVWGQQKANYNTLVDAQKDEIKACDFDDGDEDGTLLERFVARYSYIVKKYGSDTFENFVYGTHVDPSGSVRIVAGNNGGLKVETSTMIAVVSIIAIVSISSIVVLVVIKKRKHN